MLKTRIFLLIGLLVNANALAAPTSGCGINRTSGTFAYSLQVTTSLRNYKIIVPANYNKNFPYKLVVAFHGSAYSNSADTMISQTTTMRTQANQQAIFVYPDQRINGVPAHWSKASTGRDYLFFDALLALVESSYCVDDDKVFAVGFSDGGAFVNTLGCHRTNVLKGIADASGSLPKMTTCTNLPIPSFIWHGKNDTISNYDPYALKQINYRLQANGCNTASTTPSTPTTEACVEYACGTRVITCTPLSNHGFPSAIGTAMWNFFDQL